MPSRSVVSPSKLPVSGLPPWAGQRVVSSVQGLPVPPVLDAEQREPSRTGGLGPPLGIYAKSSSAPPGVDPETGELEGVALDPGAARLERFALQSVVRKILPESRTAKCLRVRQANRAEVDVFQSREHRTAHYGGLQTCGSVWACPVCAAKISERRRAELLGAMQRHQAAGGQVLLLTLTNPHTASDCLSDVLERQAAAMSRFNGSRAARAVWDSCGCTGTVRAWEVTHGANGWHPHFHLLLFVRSGLALGGLCDRFYQVWARACELAGLPAPSRAHGVRLDDGSKAAAYASKWGLEQEMTKGHIKRAKKGGRTPFDLLRAVLRDRDKAAGRLFGEFVQAFKGRRQLVWSKGLKALFEVQEMTDEAVAARQDDTARLLGSFTLDQWRRILAFDLRGELLELAPRSWQAVLDLVASLPEQPRPAAVGGGG